MLNQRLSQKLLQKLSPQQIQLMKLLQIPTDQLEQRIKEELEANPALEEAAEFEAPEDDLFSNEDNNSEEDELSDNGEELDLSEYLDDDYPDYKTQGDSYNPDDEGDNRTIPVAVSESFHENLLRQLGMVHLDENRRAIAKQIIGSIDDDGYLRREIP
ncbi:MAG TPA: RNA polymerase sigma-54 factor, partial [Bacteroidetes bacterium]|nr:RNA polymerase sigma-54 factor [Bacteroidota bacterium]